MYGTVATMTLKPGMAAELAAQLATFEAEEVAGFVGNTVYQMDADSNVCLVAVVFDSKESYTANAQSPGQASRYEAMRALLTEDPVWNDGEIIHSAAFGG